VNLGFLIDTVGPGLERESFLVPICYRNPFLFPSIETKLDPASLRHGKDSHGGSDREGILGPARDVNLGFLIDTVGPK